VRWLRRFFYSSDPEAKVAAGMSEPEARMLHELLANSGIPAMIRNMNFLSATYQAGSLPFDFDMWVKRSDLERALDILAPLLRPDQLVARHEGRPR
jgi:hypothetical protein